MKKSTRILAILMAFAMLLGSFSVMGSAYQAYKGDAIVDQYNDVDAVDFTIEQYASMALDELDRMLGKEKLVVDVFIGTLDISSVDRTLASVKELVGSVEGLLPLLGDASALPSFIVPIENVRRSNSTDLEVIYALLNFISKLSPLAEKYVNGTVSLGFLNSFIADYIFNVRNLAIGLIFGMSKEGKAMDYDAFDSDASAIPDKYTNEENGALTLLQTLLNELVLGEWKMLDEEFEDPYSYVMYESYGFKETYGEVNHDTDEYDYYGWVHPKHWVTTGLGGYKRVNEGEEAPAPIYDVVDITTTRTGYEFIETLMQTAYNQILIPVLNRDTRVWLRKLCGVEYDATKTARTVYGDDPSTPAVEDVWYENPNFDPTYDGDFDAEKNKDNPYLKFLNKDARAYPVNIPAGETFVDNFNDTLGDFLDNVLAVKRNVPNADGYSWTWVEGGNDVLFDNICSAGKFIVLTSGNLFFSEYVTVPDEDVILAMNNQQLVSFILRAILNSSVDWMYIEDEYQSIADVGYRAVEQLAWQDIPQFTYTKPARATFASDEAYYDAVVDKALDILFDVAVYNLNQGFDMVPAEGDDPVAGEGLLQYGGDDGSYETNLIQIVAWAVTEYGALLNTETPFFCDNANGETTGLTIDHVWQDIDSIVDSLIPIKGAQGSWISAEISGNGQEIVSKKLIFDHILKPIYYLDATDLAELLVRNPQGQFATDHGVKIIMTLLTNVFELLFPGVFQPKDTIDAVLNNELLGAMVGDLLKALGTVDTTNAVGDPLESQGEEIATVALPLVCMLLGLSDDQEFEEMEIYIAETIPSTQANGTAPKFELLNGSSGINTAYTDKDGNVTQDKLYTYEIANIFVRTYDSTGNDIHALTPSITSGEIAGGSRLEVALNGERTAGNLVEIEVSYYIFGEDGTELVDYPLSKTVYTYIGESNLDDDATEEKIYFDEDNKDWYIEYSPSIYLDQGDDLDDISSYSIRIQDREGDAATASVASVANATTNAFPFIAKNTVADETTTALKGDKALYFLYPFTVAEKTAGELYERFEENYQVDENGNVIYDEETGEPIPDGTDNGGVTNGRYDATTTVTVYGNTYEVPTMIHLYDDYGLTSLFERAVAANRQASNYKEGYEGQWNNYAAALKEAARLVLKPKTGSSFQADIAVPASSGYENKYEKLATELEAAIEALEAGAVNSGTTGLKTALQNYSGINYTIGADSNGYPIRVDIEYDDPAYKYFGMRDYVPHTYNKYRDARDRVTDLIESQQAFVISFEEGYELTDEDRAAYDESVAAYQERVENMGVVGSIESTYAIHMIELMGSRLIRLPGDTSKLQILYNTYGDAKDDTLSYTASSEERYDRAVAFAAKVLGESDPLPSKINQASSELVAAWKKLAVSASYVALDAEIATSKAIIDVTGTDADKQKTYTVDSYKAFLAAYDAAVNVERDLSATEDNNRYIDGLKTDLENARTGLVGAGSAPVEEPKYEFIPEPNGIFMDFGMNKEFTPQISIGAMNHDYFMSTLADGTTIDGYLVGIGEAIADEDSLLSAFGTLENVELEVVASGAGAYGTGTTIKIYNADKSELLATYVVVVVGDINGDSVIDFADEAPLFDNCNLVTEWEWTVGSEFYAAAADINNDGSADFSDAEFFAPIANGNGYVDQDIKGFGESSYVAL